MLDEKKIEESSRIIRQLISAELIVKPKPGADKFFMDKSLNSLEITKQLQELSVAKGIDTSMWMINTAYYSMFFAATALLAKHGHKIDSETGIHKLTYHALIHYFIKEENKLKRKLAEEYSSVVEDAEELLQIGENKLKKRVINLNYEQDKRKIFTYEMGQIAEKQKAEISYNRAREFVAEVLKFI